MTTMHMEDPSAVESDNESLARAFFESQDVLRGGPEPELCTPMYRAVIAANPPMSLAGHDEFAKGFYEGFPDLRHVIHETLTQDDRVVVRFSVWGTHKADFMGIPATGAWVDVGAIAILRIRAGRVAELHAELDQMGLMLQLGIAA